MLIVDYTLNCDFLLGAHTNSTIATHLSDVYNEFGGGYIIYNMR